ncbi:hypothetical protein BS47DRAFT_1483384 [Hydnum rufescens UP504]|uniref:Uncharacterized protein n=1 Tax=Hydnum rufescens UP504 TaxID=1448309 RepID=A0A9P6B3U4_9AGAM|nr:hypothetical protein BS47DRAFT_1483384 [Hydnum rufescens UP504]
MLFNLATLVLPLMFLGGIATATPLETREVGASKDPVVDVSKLKIPVSPAVVPDSEHMDLEKGAPEPGKLTTSPNSPFHTLASTAVDQFIICSQAGCRGSCTGYALSSLRRNTCYAPRRTFVSFYIYQASGAGLGYPFYVGSARCSSLTYIVRVNECEYSPRPPWLAQAAQDIHTRLRSWWARV